MSEVLFYPTYETKKNIRKHEKMSWTTEDTETILKKKAFRNCTRVHLQRVMSQITAFTRVTGWNYSCVIIIIMSYKHLVNSNISFNQLI